MAGNRLRRTGTALCAGLLTCAVCLPGTAAEDPRLAASRALAGEFAGRLQSALQQAMTESGPAAAIAVCRDQAPQIASELSRSSGARVSRTSRRFRNPGNAPEPWQQEVLEGFESGQTGEFWAAAEGAGRYMKAIRAAPLCLACHGEALSAEVLDRLDADYPHDLARGYQAGDLRGAFSIVWPEATTPAL